MARFFFSLELTLGSLNRPSTRRATGISTPSSIPSSALLFIIRAGHELVHPRGIYIRERERERKASFLYARTPARERCGARDPVRKVNFARRRVYIFGRSEVGTAKTPVRIQVL